VGKTSQNACKKHEKTQFFSRKKHGKTMKKARKNHKIIFSYSKFVLLRHDKKHEKSRKKARKKQEKNTIFPRSWRV